MNLMLFPAAEKRTIWTDNGVDQKLQRELGAIGPYEFQGKSVWINIQVGMNGDAFSIKAPKNVLRSLLPFLKGIPYQKKCY